MTKTNTAKAPLPQPAAPLVKAAVIARATGFHPRTVALWAQQGKIKSYKIGSSLRFSLEEIMATAKGGAK